ncbi:MAG: TonB-dependent receptor, partial [Parashewanella sp.]
MIKTFKHSLLAAAVISGMCLSSAAMAASNTAGSFYGSAEPKTQITYKSESTGIERTITVSESGKFNITNVPPGRYVITDSKGVSREVEIKIGVGTNVSFQSEIETIAVLGSRINSIDTTSVESTSVFDQSDIQMLPIGQNVVNVALLTPGTAQGGAAFGRNLPSFGGSSIAENGYYIDGFDVTNLRSLLNYAKLPNDAIQQTQVKTGGYGVEYGRSLGGIINVVTRSGSNDWEFGGSAIYSPNAFKASAKNVTNLNSPDVYSEFNSADKEDDLSYTLFAAGPIIQDKLFFFVNAEGRKDKDEIFDKDKSRKYDRDNPNYLAKLDWYLNEDHHFTLTNISNKVKRTRTNYKNPVGSDKKQLIQTGKHGIFQESYELESGGNILIGKYSGYLTDNFNVRLLYGKLEHDYAVTPSLKGGDCVRAIDTTGEKQWSDRINIGCWNTAQSYVTSDFPDRDERVSYKADFDWILGDHHVRFGYNVENYDSFSPGEEFTGGKYYRYIDGAKYNKGIVNHVDVGIGTKTVRIRTDNKESGKFGLENTAWYLEDSWQVTDNVLAYLAVRGETFENTDAEGNTFIKSDNLIAPRFGFSWDIDGDSSKKLYGTLGRYYIPVATNTNIRATRKEKFTQTFHFVDGINPDGTPINLGAAFGGKIVDEQIPDARKIADQNLKPMHQDELILGYQQELNQDWTVGVKFMGRTIQDGMDDFCGHDGFIDWAKDKGFTKFNPKSLQGCIVVNPGNDVTLDIDVNNDGKLETHTIDSKYLGLPEYKRHYLGLEFTAEKSFSDSWRGSFSYVLSRSFGNAEGYVNSSLGQEDAGATQDFDHARFQDGSYGNLPNDRRHQFKFYGAYEINDEVTVSANVSINSGIPLSCNGFIPLEGLKKDPSGGGSTAYDYHNFERYSGSSFYCKDKDGNNKLTKRGSEGRANWLVNTSLSVIYQPEYVEGLSVQASIFNLFNTHMPRCTAANTG